MGLEGWTGDCLVCLNQCCKHLDRYKRLYTTERGEGLYTTEHDKVRLYTTEHSKEGLYTTERGKEGLYTTEHGEGLYTTERGKERLLRVKTFMNLEDTTQKTFAECLFYMADTNHAPKTICGGGGKPLQTVPTKFENFFTLKSFQIHVYGTANALYTSLL